MNARWAEDNLQVIRTLMENSAVYRRALAPIMLTASVIGALGAIIGVQLRMDSETVFARYWMVIAIIVLVIASLQTRRQALKDNEPFWSGPAKRVAQALCLPLILGAVVTVPASLEGTHGGVTVGWWLIFYGCAIHAAGLFTPCSLRALGWLFAASGMALLYVMGNEDVSLTIKLSHVVMGVCFGGFHLAYGIYLTATRKGSNAS